MIQENEVTGYRQEIQENKRLNPTNDYDHPPLTTARFLELYYIGRTDFSNTVFEPGINFSTVKPPLDLTNMKFDGANLEKAVFDSMTLDNTTFYQAILTEASFVDVHWIGIEPEGVSDEEDFAEDFEVEEPKEEDSEQESYKISPFEDARGLDTTRWGRYSVRPPGVPLIDLELIDELQQLRIEAENLLKNNSEVPSLSHENQRLTKFVEIQARAHRICFTIGEEFLNGISDDLETIDLLMPQAYKRYETAKSKALGDATAADFKAKSNPPLKPKNVSTNQLSPSRTNNSLFHGKPQALKDYDIEFPRLPSQSQVESEKKPSRNISDITKKQYQEFTGLNTVVSSNFGIVDDELDNLNLDKIKI